MDCTIQTIVLFPLNYNTLIIYDQLRALLN